MSPKDLMNLGLSETESVLYLTLLRLGSLDVLSIVKETGFYKANTYDALEKLCNKGIVSKIIDGKRRVYQLQQPNSLVEFIKKKKTDLDAQEKLAESLVAKVKLSKKHTLSKETAFVFTGLAGVKQIYSEIIEQKLDYLVYGSPSQSDLVGTYYWQNLHQKQKENKIKARMIFHKSLKNWKEKIPKNIIDLRFFDDQFEPLTETTIYGNKVAFVVWTHKPVVTIIDNEHVAASYRQIFNKLWITAKI
ncbi:MAG: TrmB family transcriptional regulator [Candidatus Nanoarchaeia archaeon]